MSVRTLTGLALGVGMGQELAAKDAAQSNNLEIHAVPFVEPARAFAAFAGQPGAVLLDSAAMDGDLGRHAFIAADPFLTVSAREGLVTVGDQTFAGDPFVAVKELMAAHRLPRVDGLPPFCGGAVGYWGYELCRGLERIPAAGPDDLGVPDLMLGLYDVVVAFDLHERRCWIVSSGHPVRDPSLRKRRAAWRARQWQQLLEQSVVAPAGQGSNQPPAPSIPLTASCSRSAYETTVARAVEAIWDGELFQANLSQRFSAALPPESEPWQLYQRLRQVNPAPFAAYLSFDGVTIASSSPERFLQLQGDRVETRPIKGTRPRGRSPCEDEELARELCQSSKDRAENVMIVDLMRNDLSRVCCDHSVDVAHLCALESYATVHHLVSTVVGRLRPEHDAVDLLRACFPGGSVTGAPKVRAMELIAQLEPVSRGPYCGAIGYLGFDGSMDTSIVIRTMVIKDNVLSFHVGGGVVADSDPAAEYDETLVKAAALVQSLDPKAAPSKISKAVLR